MVIQHIIIIIIIIILLSLLLLLLSLLLLLLLLSSLRTLRALFIDLFFPFLKGHFTCFKTIVNRFQPTGLSIFYIYMFSLM
mgnify:CR=1 FL=1